MQTIKTDPKNYRIHDEKNRATINRSLTDLGAGRSILLDNEEQIIAGNGVFGEWGDKPIRIIETDGTELIAVKRKDLSPSDPRRQQLALIDNYSSDLSFFDESLLREDSSLLDFGKWDFDFNAEDNSTENTKEHYTKKVTSPCYVPKNEKPNLKELCDLSKTKSLIEKIDSSNISDEEKEFLRYAAYRHTVFDYAKIADYYSHSNIDTQDLFEESALVIIDFDRAIELGYVKLSEEIAEQYSEEYND